MLNVLEIVLKRFLRMGESCPLYSSTGLDPDSALAPRHYSPSSINTYSSSSAPLALAQRLLSCHDLLHLTSASPLYKNTRRHPN